MCQRVAGKKQAGRDPNGRRDCTNERGPEDGDDTTPTKWQTVECTEALLGRWMMWMDVMTATDPRPTTHGTRTHAGQSSEQERERERARRAASSKQQADQRGEP